MSRVNPSKTTRRPGFVPEEVSVAQLRIHVNEKARSTEAAAPVTLIASWANEALDDVLRALAN